MTFHLTTPPSAPPLDERRTQRDVEDTLTFLLEGERARAERVQNVLRLVVLVALAGATVMYAPSLPAPLSQANIAVLVPILGWALCLVFLSRRDGEHYPRWLSVISPVVDVSAVTAIILCYGLVGTPAVGLKAPIVFLYFAILAARPMIGSSRTAALTAAVIVIEYMAAILCFVKSAPWSLTLDPIAAATSARVSLLDEVMKVILLAVSGVVAIYATAWHERVLRRALAAQIARDAEERVMNTRLQQADKLSALGTLAATIAHDVTNPLTSIALSAEMLARSMSDPDAQSQVKAIAADARNTAAVIHDLLVFARNEDIAREPVSLDDIVGHAISMVRYLLRDRGVEISHRSTPGLPCIEASVGALERVIINLVINAAQAMEGQASPRKIQITTMSAADGVQLIVDDTGPGFAPGVMERLFERFFTTKPAGQGTGLGLWMASQVVEAYGGTITATNADTGARFTITFPRAGAMDQTIVAA